LSQLPVLCIWWCCLAFFSIWD